MPSAQLTDLFTASATPRGARPARRPPPHGPNRSRHPRAVGPRAAPGPYASRRSAPNLRNDWLSMTFITTAAVLNMSAEDIDLLSMPARAQLLDDLREHAAAFDAQNSHRNHAAVIDFFHDHGLGAPGSWVSRVNSVVLEAITRGIAMALDPHAEDYSNPGARAWASYFRQCQRGELSQTSLHARAWSEAKQIATDHAVLVATHRYQLTPTAPERKFLSIARAYNWAMANRDLCDFLITNPGLFAPDLIAAIDIDIDPDALDQLFAVDNTAVARRACEIAWALAELDTLTLQGIDRLLGLVAELLDTMRDRS